MTTNRTESTLRMALPKGRMQEGVFQLLSEAGIRVSSGSRSYRPAISLAGIEAKILKPQTIVEMLHLGSRDLGFAGADWVAELGGGCVEVLDTGRADELARGLELENPKRRGVIVAKRPEPAGNLD